MKQLLTRAFREVVDGLLGGAILKVCVYATEAKDSKARLVATVLMDELSI